MMPLDELQRFYILGLKEKLDILDAALNEKNFLKMIDIFHKMAGSGKTYGFPEISELGFEAEASLKKESNLIDAKKFIDKFRTIFIKYSN